MEYIKHKVMVKVFDGIVPAPYKIRIENLTLNTVEEHSNETNGSISFKNRSSGFYHITLDDRDEITFYHGEKYEINISEDIEYGEKVFSIDTPIKLSEGRLYIKLSNYNFRFFFPEMEMGENKFVIQKPSENSVLQIAIVDGDQLGLIIRRS